VPEHSLLNKTSLRKNRKLARTEGKIKEESNYHRPHPSETWHR
jgi:hypothetical protein